MYNHYFNYSGETATCMYNSPHETESLARVLPGKLLTLDAQCRKDRGTVTRLSTIVEILKILIQNFFLIEIQ